MQRSQLLVRLNDRSQEAVYRAEAMAPFRLTLVATDTALVNLFAEACARPDVQT